MNPMFSKKDELKHIFGTSSFHLVFHVSFQNAKKKKKKSSKKSKTATVSHQIMLNPHMVWEVFETYKQGRCWTFSLVDSVSIINFVG